MMKFYFLTWIYNKKASDCFVFMDFISIFAYI